MTQKDYWISLIHKFSSISLGVSGPLAVNQDLRSRSLDSCARPWQRCVPHNLTNTKSSEPVKKKIPKKYSTNSEEVYPVREKEANRKKFYTKVEVRHVKEVKKAVCNLSHHCRQNQCPALQRRLYQHRNDHHPRNPKENRDQGVNVTPTISGLHIAKCVEPLNSIRSVQTEITLQDIVVHKDSMPNTLSYVKNAPIKMCDTRDIVPNYNFYREHLQNEVMNWLLNVPIFYSANFTTKYLKDNILNVLVDKIDRMASKAHKEKYEEVVKVEIEDCLNILPMWLPNSISDQTLFKNGLKNKLYDKIQLLNTKFLGIQYKQENMKPSCRSYTKIEVIELDHCNDESIMKVVHNWLAKIKFTKAVPRKRIMDLIFKKISPLLNVSVFTRSHKLMLKGEIVDILDELPIYLENTNNKKNLLNKYAEDLANKLFYFHVKLDTPDSHEISHSKEIVGQCTSHIIGVPIYNSCVKLTVYDKVNKALKNANIHSKHEVKEEICDTILNSLETLRTGVEINVNNQIYSILRRTNTITEEKAKKIAKKIRLYVKIALKQDNQKENPTYQCLNPQLSGVLSIYRSNSNHPVTSTPKKQAKKHIPKLNPEEKSYINKVSALIRAWMETLPTNFDDDKNYKETIIHDLAGDIMDEVKREQLSPDTDTEKEKHLNYFIYRWLFRFDIFDDLNEAKPMIDNFLEKLKQVPVPTLTTPQHGTRQTMHFLKRIEKDFDYDQEFVPKGIDVLEDQISVWMNEQPSEIYANSNKKKRNKMVKDLALTLQDRLRSKSPENEIEKDINIWLNTVVKPKEKEHIGLLTQNLKDKIINVPQDETLEARHEKRQRQRAEYRKKEPSASTPEIDHVERLQLDTDKTMREFILKYVDHYYDIDDPLARGAFGQLLKVELRKLHPPTRKDVYDNLAKDNIHDKFRPERLNEVLEYIKIISDWLSNIPIQPSYNIIGNIPRIEFVNDLARNIQEVEEQRKEHPHDMDYDNFISSVISRSMHTYNIPVLPEHINNVPLMVNQLLTKIVANRSVTSRNGSTISDIKEQNLSEFIEEYIRINGKEIADDKLKLEAWTTRLQQEIKNMLHEGADPATLCKGHIYEKFATVPIPGPESIRRFSLEISYVKKISNWLQNLPLLPIHNEPAAQKERVEMISELAEKIADRETKKNMNPNNNTADKDLVQYISNWISKLPLDPRKHIIEPIVIQQLMNTIDKVVKIDQTLPDQSKTPHTPPTKDTKYIKTTESPQTHFVDFIENWCNKLPFKGDNIEVEKQLKGDIARHLYQKIGELNLDPRVFNDDVLFKDLLEDEIDTQLENLPQDLELQNHRESLKHDLLNNILGIKKVIEQKSTGDHYKHKLETTIDAAIPDPIQSRQIIDPGFEIYKNHLTNMFILDNFDNSNEDVKAKYENKIRNEIDKYFESAQNKNALPITKDEMFNELYSELFKVPMPNKDSIIDEVEEVKTKCEVEAWFEELPLRDAEGVIEYLEWDQIVSTLAKKIHEIEKNEPNPDEKIQKEITKWLGKLPLLPGQEVNIGIFTDKLQEILKSSKEARKYVATEPKKASKGKAIKKHAGKVTPNMSQVAGPHQPGEMWVSPPLSPKSNDRIPVNGITHTPKKKSGDLIVEIVEDWCNQLPIIGDQIQNKIMKDNMSTQIVMKICELNMDANIFSNDIIYDQLLDEEIHKIMSRLVGCCGLEKSKLAMINQLKQIVQSVKPIIKEEKERHQYKTELNQTVVNVLNDHNDTKAKITEFNKLKEAIVDNFVEYNYNRSDDEAKQIYKTKIHDAVVKYVTTVQDKNEKFDPLVKRNQLLCELSKIPMPANAILKAEVEEIKMKNELKKFFEKNSIYDKTEKTAQMEKSLAKRLNDIEKFGHTDPNDKKMKSEIAKCLDKINKHVSSKAIDDFVDNLKNNEAERKSSPLNISTKNESDVHGRQPNVISSRFARSVEGTGSEHQQFLMKPQTDYQQPTQYLQVPTLLDQSHCRSAQKWVSLELATPLPIQTTGYYNRNNDRETRQGSDSMWHPPLVDESQYQPGNYENFIASPFRSSSKTSQSFTPSDIHTNIKQGQPVRSIGQAFDNNAYTTPSNQIHDTNIQQYPQNNSYYLNPLGPSPGQHTGYQGYDANLDLTVAPPQIAELSQGQPLNYDQFNPMLTGTMLSQRYISPEQLGNVSQRYTRAPDNMGNIRPYTPSNQGSLYEVPVYGQVATPRIVQGEAQPFEMSNTEDGTPESLFRAPTFVPRRLYSPLTVPRESPGENQRPTRQTSGKSIRPGSPSVGLKRRWKEPAEVESSENVRYRCKCDKKLKKFDSGPYCMIPMDEYCDNCGGFCPMWCRMPLPPCFYLH